MTPKQSPSIQMKTKYFNVNNKTFLLFILITLSCNQNSFCQADYPPPSGIWCSCPPSNGRGTGSVVPAVAEKDYVQGILVRVVWSDLEPTNDIYDWSLIDDQITAANTYEKNISLAVGGGPNSPDWLYEIGADSIHFDFPFSGTIPVPWDSTFLAEWTSLIIDLGARYQNDTTIQLVYMTNATSNGFEMQMPFSPSPTYEELGYTEEKVINSWRTVIDQFNAVFPNHYLTNDFHPVNTSDEIGEVVYTYATETIGERYGANAWWWTQNNTEVYPAQYGILQHSTDNNIYSGVQFAKSGVSDSASFGPGGLPAALELAIENNICYWEVWNADIIDGGFDSLFTAAKCVVDDLKISDFSNTSFKLYPNPTRGELTIIMNRGQIQEISIYNAIGDAIQSHIYNESNNIRIDLNELKSGIYYVQITTENGEQFTEKILLMR